ncbi:MAG: PAS and ANTAR domain-containing protein [Intrasporangium sp.]|uniref:PAS and ANTAR domain-containing protein n=1 Tax=Intrasporangium sp. TaxID=1925024 RepID=UPI003F7DB6B9
MSKRKDPARHFTRASAPPVAAYRYDAVADQLWWSPQMYELFGFAPGDVVPTLALMDAHIHPDDRKMVHEVCCPAWRTGRPFTIRHRILDAGLGVRDIIAVGESILAGDRYATVHAYYVDVTTAIGKDVRAGVTVALEETLRTRGVIDQVKGAVMLAYGVDADTAFTLLRGISNNHNLRLAQLAYYVADRLSSVERGAEPAQETLFQILASVAEHRAVIEAWPLPDAPAPTGAEPVSSGASESTIGPPTA